LKVSVVGDGGVGKTSLCFRATEGAFQENCELTIGANVFKYEIKTDKLWRLMLFDLGGQDAKQSPNADVFIRGSSAAILIYDISSILSFFSLETDWLPFIKNVVPKIPIVVCGSKLDIEPGHVEVSIDIVDAFMAENAGHFNLVAPPLRVSAKTGENIEQVMRKVVESIALYQQLGISD